MTSSGDEKTRSAALATVGDTTAATDEGLGLDPFQYNQSFPTPVDEWTVLNMHGMGENVSTTFSELARADGDVDVQGRPMLRREKLRSLAASELHFALICQRPGGDVKILLERMPHLVEQPDSRGHSPLHIAVMNGDAEVVTALLDAGAPVNARTAVQNTPLHLCYDKPEMVVLLIEAGAQVEVLNKWQKTPLDWCNASLNSKTGPVGASRKIMEKANADFDTQVARAKQHQIKIDTRRKLAAKAQAAIEAAAEASKAAAEAFMAQFQEQEGSGDASEEGGAGEGGEEKWEEEQEETNAGVSSLQALTASKGAEFAQELFSGVKQAKGNEINRSKKDMRETQKVMAEIGSDRGLSFNRFVSGNHGGREIDVVGVERHKAHKVFLKEHRHEMEEEGDEEGEEGEDEEDEDAGDGQTAYSSVTGGEMP